MEHNWDYVRTTFPIRSSSYLNFPRVTSERVRVRVINSIYVFEFFSVFDETKHHNNSKVKGESSSPERFIFFSSSQDFISWYVRVNCIVDNWLMLSDVSAPSFSRLIENYSKRNWRNYCSDCFYHAIIPIFGTTHFGFDLFPFYIHLIKFKKLKLITFLFLNSNVFLMHFIDLISRYL